MSGLGRTLLDGHRHEVRWTPERLGAGIAFVQDEASRAGTIPSLEVLVQRVMLTDDRDRVLAEFAAAVGGPLTDVLDLSESPYLLIGTVEEMAAQIGRQAEVWNLRAHVVREGAVAVIEQVLRLLG